MIFCLAQFLDAVSNTALFSTIPAIAESLDMTPDESTWVISAFSLTFSSFLLIVSESERYPFIVGHLAISLNPDIMIERKNS